MNRRDILTIVLSITFVTLVVYFGINQTPKARPAPAPGARMLLNKPAPDFTLTSLDGQQLRLSDYRGKVVILNFWATWCGPCKVELPWFIELENKYHDQGLQVVGVSMDDVSKERVQTFAKDMGINYPIVMGKEKLGEEYGGVEGLPTTFYIDRSGKVIDTVAGLLSKSQIEENIKKAL